MKKIQFSVLILALTALPSMAQEARLGTTELPDSVAAESPLAKQIARDKQLLEIWKDHVRTLTRERDEAYQKIRELQNNQEETSASSSGADPEAFKILEDQKTAALKEAEELRGKLSAAESQIERIQAAQRNQQFAVEVQPSAGGAAPGSQKFYADLTKNYMLQQETVKKLKAEVARRDDLTATTQKDYDTAVLRVRELESQIAQSTADLQNTKNLLSQIQAENDRLGESLAGTAAKIEDLETQKSVLQEQTGALREDRERTLKESAEATLRAETLSAENSQLKAAIEKITAENRQVRSENEKLAEDNENLAGRLKTQTERSDGFEQRLAGTQSQLAETRRQAESAEISFKTEIDSLKKRLQSNASDIQNLKENFNTLLEPLVSSFDERQ